MTTPRIEETVEEFDREYIVIKRPECNVSSFEALAGDGNRHILQEINLTDVLLLTQAHQAGKREGKDEAVEKLQKEFSKHNVYPMTWEQESKTFADGVLHAIKALQDNK